MATKSGRADPSVADLLFAEGYGFDFFQAVRVLERLQLDRQPVGYDAAPAREAVRFRTHVTLDFPPSAIHEVMRDQDGGRPPAMTVAFMGLTGPLGVLPRHYTEMLLERARRKDFALHDFLDLFNHRLISLFYRAWEKYRFPVAYERALSRRQADDRFSHYLFDLFGMGTRGLRGRLAVQDRPLLFYAGLLAQHRHSACALDGLLTDYFGVPAQVVQFVGQWLPLAEEDRTRLGTANHTLGVSTVAGSRVWDQQAKFKLRLGPLTLDTFRNFLPSGGAFAPLVHVARFFVGQQFDFDVQLVIEAAEVPYCRLGGTDTHAPRLGWSAWLKTKEFAHDAADAVFSGHVTRLGALPG